MRNQLYVVGQDAENDNIAKDFIQAIQLAFFSKLFLLLLKNNDSYIKKLFKNTKLKKQNNNIVQNYFCKIMHVEWPW